MDSDYIINYCNYNSNIIKIIINYFEVLLSNQNFTKFVSIPYEWSLDFIKTNISIIKNNIDNIILLSNISKNDTELLKIINYDTYVLLKFILSTPKADLLLNKKININDDLCEYDVKFYNNKKLKEDNYKYLFHGSDSTNWYSILVNGLKNCSGTNMMKNGQAYGPGIYFSNDISISEDYSRTNMVTIGVFKISLDNYNKYKKTSNIFVVSTDDAPLGCGKAEDKIELVSLIIYNKRLNINESNIINQYYDKTIFDNELSNKLMLTKISNKRINNEYKILSQKYNISNNNNTWEIELNDIILKVLFFDYPINPPFIFIKNKILLENNNIISKNGAINCNLMSQSYWYSTMKIDDIINYINDIIKKISYVKLEEHNKFEDSLKDYKLFASKYFWRVYHL